MKNYFLFLFVIVSTTLFSQEKSIATSLIATEFLEADIFVGKDKFGFNYYIKNNVFFKKDNQELFQYKNVALGKIMKVDLLNPLKIILFYENFNTIIIVDNQLNEIQKINFSENQTPIVASAFGIAAQNKLWLFNNLTQQLGLFDLVKNNFQALATPFSTSIKLYQSDYNHFYWVDILNHAYSCDLFGRINSLGKIPVADGIKFISTQEYIYSKENQLYWVDRNKNETNPIIIDKKSFKSFSHKEQILTIFTDHEISTFKIQLP
ncbi:hypothetical protein [Flavobacterium sp. UBA6135]|uniref:hypothetical protein n=1 Tax=Flavobacterium sp. UBA6135 TaxID=1946553 RepID=UPI0025C7275A|nr:hypothetical protein [Flavobacterium sp. UBA6135]